MPQDYRNWRRPHRDWDDERDYERGRDERRGEQRGYGGRGYEDERGSSPYGGTEDHDSRQDRDYEGVLRAGDYGGYGEEEGRSSRPRFRSGQPSTRGYGKQNRGYEGSRDDYGAREYGNYSEGYGYGDSSTRSQRQSGAGFGRYSEDYDRTYAGGAWSSRYNPSDREYRNRDRGLWDKATDEVSSWFGDEDAKRRRRGDEHRGRGPKNYTRSDDRIHEDVSDRLTDDPLVDASDIAVAVQSQEVTLTGTVSSRNEKHLAEETAESVSGVKHVQNNLRVKDRQSWQSSQTVSSRA